MLEAGHRLAGTIAPLDGGGSLASPAAAYGLRRLKSSYTGPGIKLRRTTGGTQDINFLGFTGFTGAPLDTAAANAFCASTTCFVDTWYDQSGNARHATQATTANQPAFVFNCTGTLPCVQTTGAAQGIGVSVLGGGVGAQSFSAVALEAAPTGCIWIAAVNNRFIAGGTGSLWQVDNSAVGVNTPISLGVWHAGSGVVNGAGSVINVDGVEVTGTVAVDATSGGSVYQFFGAGGCSETEAVWWNTYALTAGERAALRNNQKSFWNTP